MYLSSWGGWQYMQKEPHLLICERMVVSGDESPHSVLWMTGQRKSAWCKYLNNKQEADPARWMCKGQNDERKCERVSRSFQNVSSTAIASNIRQTLKYWMSKTLVDWRQVHEVLMSKKEQWTQGRNKTALEYKECVWHEHNSIYLFE